MRQGFKSASNSPEEINFSKIFDLFQSRWYFVVISLLISIVLCKLYLRYTKPIFQASASVRVEEDDNLQNFGLMQAFGFGNWTDNIQSEIQLIRSRSMVNDALKEMDIHCLYYLVGTVVPMLPEKLSNGLCSLVEGQDRLCRAVILTFDRRGRITEARFAATVIRSRKRLTYRQAYGLLFTDDLAAIRALPLPTY